MKKLTLQQVGLLLQAIYDTEIHFKLEWMWDGGFQYAFGFEGANNAPPQQVRDLWKTIDNTKLDEIASLILLEYELCYSIFDSNGKLNEIGKFIEELKN